VGVVHVISFAPLNVSYLKKTPQEVFPFWMVIEGVSIHEVKMERLLKHQGVNVTYWYHSQWRDVGSRVESFDEKEMEITVLQIKNK
jgi:hypothetical protein